MATVGHTLVGLSLGASSTPHGRGGVLAWAWIGFVVLLAHLVDLVEWVPILVGREPGDRHFPTHSALLNAALVAAVWLALALGTRIRRPLPYLAAALAIVSHSVLDAAVVRDWIGAFYTGEATPRRLEHSIDIAEVWLFGLPLVVVMLVQAMRRVGDDPPRRAVVATLGLAALAAALTRNPVLWLPAYALALGLGLWGLRDLLRPRLLLNLVPLAPLALLVAVEWHARRLFWDSGELLARGDCAGAVALMERVRALPTRSQNRWIGIRLGRCYQELGRLEQAEAALLEVDRAFADFDAPRFYLARLYSDPRSRDTPLFRPEEAERLLAQIESGPYRSRSARLRKEWRERGISSE